LTYSLYDCNVYVGAPSDEDQVFTFQCNTT
jgi:hypothetical protein